MGALAFVIEGFIMIFHTHTETLLEGHIHRLLALTIICSMIIDIGEWIFTNNFSLIVARSYFALTQGTWFIQAAFVLWPLSSNPYFIWDRNSHDSILYTTMCYAYHLSLNAIIIIILYLIIHKFVSRSIKLNPNQVEDDGYKLIINQNDQDN
jgi:hypothetical protein